jgi:hypothetical protein
VNPKDKIGLTKAPLGLVPPALVIETAPAMANGAKKYGAYNWREEAVSLMVYLSAAQRHLLAYQDGEELAEDSGVKHLAHAAACIAIILDAASIGKLIDDRPTPGAAAKLLAAQSVQLAPVRDDKSAVLDMLKRSLDQLGIPYPPPLPPFKPGNSQGCTLKCHPDGRWGGISGIGQCDHHLGLSADIRRKASNQ